MIRSLAIAIAIIVVTLCLIYPLAHAQYSHAQYHDVYYKNWINKRGAGCCNGQDCTALDDADERTNHGTLEVRIQGQWCEIKPYHYLKTGNVPDASTAHVCVQKNVVPNAVAPCDRLLCYQPKPMF